MGRFIAADPIGLGGGDVNLYRYVRNDPVGRMDPLGLVTDQEVAQVLGRRPRSIAAIIAVRIALVDEG